MFKNRAEWALFLIDNGYTASEITQICGYKNQSAVRNLAKYHGKKIKKPCTDKHDAMRKYKADGHTNREVAEKFGMSVDRTKQICRGIAPQETTPINKGVLQDLDNVIRIINERAPGFEYAGNYTGSDGHVDLRCKKCGHIRTANWNTLRHKGTKTCPNCLEIEKQRREAEAKSLLEANKLQSECNKRGKEVVRLLTRVVKLHRCPVCGKVTENKYCSSKCCQKANWITKEARRRKRIQDALIDKDISVQGLYERDNGVCAICGGKCDWSDHLYRGRTFIVGINYPTIDHIIPLVKGGTHSWDNVQLAHFGCNSAKGASLVG